MSILTKQINQILAKKDLSHRKLAQLINEHDSSLNAMIRGKRAFPEDVIQKLAPILEISPEEIKGWILTDKYPENVIKRALLLKQTHAGDNRLIFTIKIHELMKQHNLTINPFAKAIGYNQGWLSQVVLGKEPVSKKLMQKLCDFSGLSEDEITSWTVADKYSIEVLRVAIKQF